VGCHKISREISLSKEWVTFAESVLCVNEHQDSGHRPPTAAGTSSVIFTTYPSAPYPLFAPSLIRYCMTETIHSQIP
jgi:hypothetical protein